MKLNCSSQSTTIRREHPRGSGMEYANNPGDWSFVVGRPIRQTNRSAQGRIRLMRLCAFTRIELLVVLIVLAILCSMILPAGRPKAKVQRIRCVNNLKNIGLAQRLFSEDHGEKLLGEINLNRAKGNIDDYASNILSLSNRPASPTIFYCPADKNRKPANDWKQFQRESASYFLALGVDAMSPQEFFAGDRNLTTNATLFGPGRVEIATANAAWDLKSQHRGQGNVELRDGSVQQLSSARLRDQLANTGLKTNVFIFP